MAVSLTSCHSYLDITGQNSYETYQGKPHVWVLNLTTDHGKTVHFRDGYPGKMVNNEVTAVSFSKVEIKHGTADSVVFLHHKPIPRYVWNNGNRYKIIKSDRYSMTIRTSDTISIPFSEISQMHIKTINKGKTTLLILGCAGAGAGVVIGVLYLFLYLISLNLSIGM
jgi:predicted PilT family ATPase